MSYHFLAQPSLIQRSIDLAMSELAKLREAPAAKNINDESDWRDMDALADLVNQFGLICNAPLRAMAHDAGVSGYMTAVTDFATPDLEYEIRTKVEPVTSPVGARFHVFVGHRR